MAVHGQVKGNWSVYDDEMMNTWLSSTNLTEQRP